MKRRFLPLIGLLGFLFYQWVLAGNAFAQNTQKEPTTIRELVDKSCDPQSCPPVSKMVEAESGGRPMYTHLKNLTKKDVWFAFKDAEGNIFLLFDLLKQPKEFDEYVRNYWIKGNKIYPVKGGQYNSLYAHERASIFFKLAFEDPRLKGDNGSKREDVKKKGLVFYSSNVSLVNCDGKKANLTELSDSEIEQLVEKLKSGDIQFEDLPNIRKPSGLYKITGSDTYIFFDTPVYSTKEKTRVFTGPAGALKEEVIEGEEYYLDGGTTVYKIKGKGIIYFPSAFTKDKKMTWTPLDLKSSAEIEKVDFDNAFLQKLGLDISAYVQAEFPTPCDGLLKSSFTQQPVTEPVFPKPYDSM